MRPRFLDPVSRRPLPCTAVRASSFRHARWPIVALCLGCAGGFETGEPLSDPAGVAARAAEATGAARPVRVIFRWEYADERGNLRGDGVGRVNPPDRFRLDLFSTGEGSMRAVLVDDQLRTGGDLQDVELPPPAFLYAMTGVFRPGSRTPSEGFSSGPYEVVGYAVSDRAVRRFYLLDGRLARVEERRDGRLERRIELEWGEDPVWPREARYRDDVAPRSRVRWELVRAVPQTQPFDDGIYDVDPAP